MEVVVLMESAVTFEPALTAGGLFPLCKHLPFSPDWKIPFISNLLNALL